MTGKWKGLRQPLVEAQAHYFEDGCLPAHGDYTCACPEDWVEIQGERCELCADWLVQNYRLEIALGELVNETPRLL